MKCYEIKKCPFNGTDNSKSKCSPHKLQIGCWEYNWVSFYKKIPECNEKLKWREEMLKRCLNCEIYPLYKKDIDKFLKGLKEAY
ncbi:MAG: hypothetical protein FH753_00760 [Firmicutes bacterium]|nr:hypothetical protein [Bacillota bacterium]